MAIKRKSAGDVDINMTPMIDCTFQLIIFFILTTQMANDELAPLKVPTPHQSIAMSEETGRTNRVIINIVNSYGSQTDDRNPIQASVAEHYRIGAGEPVDVGDIEALKDRIRQRREAAIEQGLKPEDFFVEIRCDKDIAYAYVEPVLLAASDLKITKMNVTAAVDPSVAAQQQ